jgi:tetratricopeptide (TPR) repeat protein
MTIRGRSERAMWLRLRTAALVSLVCAAVLTGCGTSDEYVESTIQQAREHADRRDYEGAQQQLDSALEHLKGNSDLLFEKAEIYARAHEFENAEEWYARAAEADPRSWKATSAGWDAEYRALGKTGSAREQLLGEAREFLDAAPESLVNLSAFVDLAATIGDEDDYETEGDALMSLFPESEIGSDLIKEELDWIGVERDDERRLEMADEFLEKHPVSSWRPRAMRLKLVSLERLGRYDEVEAEGLEWAARHSDRPEDLNIVASAFVSSDRAPDEAAALAARAVELALARCSEEGIDVIRRGSRTILVAGREGRSDREESDGRPDGEESDKLPDREELEERADEISSYHLTHARALIKARHYAAAEEAARAAISLLDLDENDEETGAAHHFVLGRALEGEGRDSKALDEYLASLVAGGRQNRWPARADTAATRVLAAMFPGDEVELLDYTRTLLRYDGPMLNDVTGDAGLGGRTESRVAWGDYDGDGWDDLLLNGRVLFRNRRDGTFEDVTDDAGIGGTGTNGAVWADVDNDGDLDFYATSGATSGEKTDRLWLNSGDGTFEDATEAAGGMTDLYTTEGAAWGDYDGDGLVDLYLASYERPRTETFTEYGIGFPDILYHNEGGAVFRNVSQEAGLVPPFGENLSGRGVNWGDFDNDGDLDIFVSNYRLQENLLWRNEGDGTFTDVAPELGVSGHETDGWWGHTIGSEWGDYDNDGDLDLFSANLAHPRYIEVSDMSMLLENGGPPYFLFTDVRAASGIKYAETHSDPVWWDADSDGDLDLFITSIYPNCGSFLYRNTGRGHFEDVTWLAGARTFNGWGCAVSDFDHDGDLDLAVGSGSGFRLLRNDGVWGAERPSHWLQVRVDGVATNAAGLGARIRVAGRNGTQIREIEGGKGTTSQNSLAAFFGLGDDPGPVDVDVSFSGGPTVGLKAVDLDRIIVVRESDGR